MTTAEPLTIRDQDRAILALRVLATEFPHLPAADFLIGIVCPPGQGGEQGVRVGLHGSLTDFEVWREALGIDPATVVRRELPDFQTLTTYTSFAGATVELIGFGDPSTVVMAAAEGGH